MSRRRNQNAHRIVYRGRVYREVPIAPAIDIKHNTTHARMYSGRTVVTINDVIVSHIVYCTRHFAFTYQIPGHDGLRTPWDKRVTRDEINKYLHTFINPHVLTRRMDGNVRVFVCDAIPMFDVVSL